jgi:hypothetical protein
MPYVTETYHRIPPIAAPSKKPATIRVTSDTLKYAFNKLITPSLIRTDIFRNIAQPVQLAENQNVNFTPF